MVLLLNWSILFALINNLNSFYLPGLAPKSYNRAEKVEIDVNALTPLSRSKEVLKSIMSYDYYDKAFGFCQPGSGPSLKESSLGSIIFGDRIYNSPFEINLLQDENCKLLCKKTVSPSQAKFVNKRIKENYAHNWLVDGLPVARRKNSNGKLGYSAVYLGNFEPVTGSPFLHNHFDIKIQYHSKNDRNYRIVGAELAPRSLKNPMVGDSLTCSSDENLHLSEDEDTEVYYSYSITWEESDVSWATRWDKYLNVNESSIHWFSLINSTIIAVFLTGMVAMIILRALHKDILRYNTSEDTEDIQEDFGWKLVHGDVFRTPRHRMFLSILTGNGIQILSMMAIVVLLGILGFLSPANRGSLSTSMIVFYMLFGSISGYVSARLYKTLGGQNWKSNIILTAFLFPGILLFIFLFLNLFLWRSNSSSAVPFGAMFSLFSLWILLSTPLSFIGGYYGFNQPGVNLPVRTNQIPRQIPKQPGYLRLLPSIAIGGILPFIAIFMELYFIMNSLWFHRFYYLFGFLSIVIVILVATCAEVAMLLCYFHLCTENYNWWWRSFFTSGSTGIYVFLYSIFYYYSKTNLDNISNTVVYFGWSLVASIMTSVVTGSVGFIAGFVFVRKIYSTIKVD